MTNPLFELEGMNAWYGTAQALFDVSLDVKSGEMIGLLGRNGAGKSTTFKSVLGIEARRTGIARLAGIDLSKKSPEAIARAGIAWVPPDRRIFPDLTVRENLQLAARARRVPLDIDQITDALPLLLPLLDRNGDQLSGGEQQAVAVARALAGQPKVLLLDEPTEGLAPLVVNQLEAAIAELPKKFDLAVILAEQNLQFVLRLVKRVFVLETGRVVYRGASEEFEASPELQHRYLSVSAAGT